jgi:hypothetical protein
MLPTLQEDTEVAIPYHQWVSAHLLSAKQWLRGSTPACITKGKEKIALY